MRAIITIFLASVGLNLFAQSDIIKTTRGDLKITPVSHATMVMEWLDQVIYFDPTGGTAAFEGFKPPTMVFITDIHGDHMDVKTLQELDLTQATIFAPNAVAEEVKKTCCADAMTILVNGTKTQHNNVQIDAIPMYNLPESDDAFHPKGRGNGYVLTFGDKRIYVSGDTEDIPEMRALKNIDAAFVCMNLPYTMTIEQAASAVLDFQPKIVYPFHYRGKDGKSDVSAFKDRIEAEGAEVDIRLLEWYPK